MVDVPLKSNVVRIRQLPTDNLTGSRSTVSVASTACRTIDLVQALIELAEPRLPVNAAPATSSTNKTSRKLTAGCTILWPITAPTTAEKRELLRDYACYFYRHVDEKYQGPLRQTSTLNRMIWETFESVTCNDIHAFHATVDRLSKIYLSNLRGDQAKIAKDFGRLRGRMGMWGWCSKCLSLPMHEKRRAYLKEVFNLLKDDKGSPIKLCSQIKMLYTSYALRDTMDS